MRIPTYIINLPERVDRKQHVLQQFSDKPEFDVSIVSAEKHKIGAVGLWMSIRKIISDWMRNTEQDFILICEDDHKFTKEYNFDNFCKCINEASKYNTEILFGGVGFVQNIVPVSNNLYWVDNVWCTQFIVIFKDAFQTICDANFSDNDVADEFLCKILSNKLVIWPFISKQKEFGYSDVTESNTPGNLTKLFRETSMKFERYNMIYKRLNGI